MREGADNERKGICMDRQTRRRLFIAPGERTRVERHFTAVWEDNGRTGLDGILCLFSGPAVLTEIGKCDFIRDDDVQV